MAPNDVTSAFADLRRNREQLVYADVGSAGGIPMVYRELSRMGAANVLLFDPQDDWRKNANAAEYDGCKITLLKVALAEQPGTRTLHVTSAPGCSSLFLPNQTFLERYPVREWFAVTKMEPIVVTTFSLLQSQLQLPTPDIVKADVQGLELEVLRGFGTALNDVACVELEVCLEEMYIGQPTLPVIYAFMRRNGFILRDLKPQGPFEGAAVEFNSYWSRPFDKMTPRQGRITRLWQAAHSLWPGEFFENQNRGARDAVRFTDD